LKHQPALSGIGSQYLVAIRPKHLNAKEDSWKAKTVYLFIKQPRPTTYK